MKLQVSSYKLRAVHVVARRLNHYPDLGLRFGLLRDEGVDALAWALVSRKRTDDAVNAAQPVFFIASFREIVLFFLVFAFFIVGCLFFFIGIKGLLKFVYNQFVLSEGYKFHRVNQKHR